MGLMDDLEIVEKISVIATKENTLLLKLKGMQKEWGEMSFETKDYRNTGTSVIGGTEDILTLMDDQIVITPGQLWLFNLLSDL